MKNLERNNYWDLLKEWCLKTLGLTERQLDLLSVYLVLDYTAKGLSINDISDELELEPEQVISDLLEFTEFSGLKITLAKNPIVCYNRGITKECFHNNFLELTDDESSELFDFIEKFLLLREEIESFG